MFAFAWEGLKLPGEKVLYTAKMGSDKKIAITYTDDTISLKEMKGVYCFNAPKYVAILASLLSATLCASTYKGQNAEMATYVLGFITFYFGVGYPLIAFTEKGNIGKHMSFVRSEGYKPHKTREIGGVGEFIKRTPHAETYIRKLFETEKKFANVADILSEKTSAMKKPEKRFSTIRKLLHLDSKPKQKKMVSKIG